MRRVQGPDGPLFVRVTAGGGTGPETTARYAPGRRLSPGVAANLTISCGYAAGLAFPHDWAHQTLRHAFDTADPVGA
ncbi:hypothetical protein [Embleya sp. NPDC059237]|uniref:hypothetical protein n=1 Tax=Embleya sp. NPDC059237 TaxID=3346784 RepID=UPI0036A08EEF